MKVHMTPSEKRLLEFFQAGYRLTAVDGVSFGFGTDLRKRVSNLKKAGYEIHSEWESKNEKRFKRYFL